jgi:hypothetical protein
MLMQRGGEIAALLCPKTNRGRQADPDELHFNRG